MAAAARAAARRQAILNSRGDRLAKLTSSARGDDPGGVYANNHDDPPLPIIGSGLKGVIGDDAPPYPAVPKRTPSSGATSDEPQMPDWNSEQQQELLRALMGGAVTGQPSSQGFPPGVPSIAGASKTTDSSAPGVVPEDPFSALLASFGGQEGIPFAAAAPPSQTRTLIQKLIPVLHLVSMIMLVIWFVTWKEPEEFTNVLASTVLKSNEAETEMLVGYDLKGSGWKRWARLSKGPPSTMTGLVVPPLPTFFWAFTTVELLLHSLRLFSEPNTFRPPVIIGLVLPYLPPPFPKAILTCLKYFQTGSLVLDDLAILIFGIGLVVFISNQTT